LFFNFDARRQKRPTRSHLGIIYREVFHRVKAPQIANATQHLRCGMTSIGCIIQIGDDAQEHCRCTMAINLT
jgi:hypothetical protein